MTGPPLDAHRRRAYPPPARGGSARRDFERFAAAFGLLAIATAAACAPLAAEDDWTIHPAGSGAQNGTVFEDVVEIERALILATAPDRPVWVVFDWSAQEREGRFSGRGVLRAQDPYRVRLDLFGPRGEGYLTAAVVERDLRLPRGVEPGAVPPVPMLWGVMGVFMPPAEAQLMGVDREGDRTRLRYAKDSQRWTFEFEDERLRAVDWREDQRRRQSIELRGLDDSGLPREVVYRDWAEYTELTMRLDEVDHVEPFSPEIWDPGAP